MAAQDVRDGLTRGFNAYAKAQGVMDQARAVMDRLPRKSGPQGASVSLQHADTADDVVQELVPGAVHLRRDR